MEVEVVEIEGKEYFIVDTIDNYNYLCEMINPNNMIVLKDIGEELVSLSDKELDEALIKYYKKHE